VSGDRAPKAESKKVTAAIVLIPVVVALILAWTKLETWTSGTATDTTKVYEPPAVKTLSSAIKFSPVNNTRLLYTNMAAVGVEQFHLLVVYVPAISIAISLFVLLLEIIESFKLRKGMQ
jgi:hypothetical protein